MALGAAFGGTLALGQVLGVESHAELLLLLATVAGIAFVFERVALPAVRNRAAVLAVGPDSDRAHAPGDGQHESGDVAGARRRGEEDVGR